MVSIDPAKKSGRSSRITTDNATHIPRHLFTYARERSIGRYEDGGLFGRVDTEASEGSEPLGCGSDSGEDRHEGGEEGNAGRELGVSGETALPKQRQSKELEKGGEERRERLQPGSERCKSNDVDLILSENGG